MLEHSKGDSVQVKLGKYFLNGLILIFPFFVTIYVLKLLIGFADSVLTAPLKMFPWAPPPGIGLIITVTVTILLGSFATNIVIKKVFAWTEEVLMKIPIAKTIYSTAQQVNDILFLQKEKTMFRRACLAQFPYPGSYAIGFITNKGPKEAEVKTGKDMINVFIPSTPSPATGFTVIVPRDSVIMLDMPLDDAMKLVVSGGVLSPHKFKELIPDTDKV